MRLNAVCVCVYLYVCVTVLGVCNEYERQSENPSSRLTLDPFRA